MKTVLFLRISLFACLFWGAGAYGANMPAPGITSVGLTLKVPRFSCASISFEGASIEALPSRTQYLVLNLGTRTLHTLPRDLGDGELVLACVTTSASEVMKIEPRDLALPRTRIPRTLAKLQRKEPLVVRCFGSSLVANGAGKNGWQTLVFNRGSEDARFRAGGTGLITNTNYGVGGSNARYSATLFGEAFQGGRRFPSPVYDTDLAVVALLPNGGADRNAVFEGVIRMLRARKVEVLLLTDNSFAGLGDTNGLWGAGVFVRALADRYDCAIADTAAYMWEGELRGAKVYGDSIHQSAIGNQKWAEAACGPLALVEGRRMIAPVAPAGAPTVEPNLKIPGKIEVVFDPSNTGGARVVTARQSSLAAIYGVPNIGRLELSQGSRLLVEHQKMMAADFVCDAASSFTLEVRERGKEVVVKTITYKAPEKSGSRPQTTTLFSATELKQASTRAYDVKITSGTLQLYAVAYHIP